MAVLRHVRKLNDALGHFLVQITCRCGARRVTEPESLARLSGPATTLAGLGKRMHCSKCGAREAEVVAISIPRPRGRGFGGLDV